MYNQMCKNCDYKLCMANWVACINALPQLSLQSTHCSYSQSRVLALDKLHLTIELVYRRKKNWTKKRSKQTITCSMYMWKYTVCTSALAIIPHLLLLCMHLMGEYDTYKYICILQLNNQAEILKCNLTDAT